MQVDKIMFTKLNQSQKTSWSFFQFCVVLIIYTAYKFKDVNMTEKYKGYFLMQQRDECCIMFENGSKSGTVGMCSTYYV